MEEALSGMSRKLIEAQKQERGRIARDLQARSSMSEAAHVSSARTRESRFKDTRKQIQRAADAEKLGAPMGCDLSCEGRSFAQGET
jgi:hypothetical protein